MNRNIVAYDFVRTLAIVLVFLAHNILDRDSNGTLAIIAKTLSPGLTMSLLGFLSGLLLAGKSARPEEFYVRRFSRIYCSLWVCLIAILIYLNLRGEHDLLTQDSIIHFAGLSAFFGLFHVESKSPLGPGLWFITAIVGLYLVLPIITVLLRHRNGVAHLVMVLVACFALDSVMHGLYSTFNVIESFIVGVFIGERGWRPYLESPLANWPYAIGAFLLIGLCGAATLKLIPNDTRQVLYPLYPVAFMPLASSVASHLPTSLTRAVTYFSGVSYEFYLIHFYTRDLGWMPGHKHLGIHLAASFAITLAIATVLAMLASAIRTRLESYLLMRREPSVVTAIAEVTGRVSGQQ